MPRGGAALNAAFNAPVGIAVHLQNNLIVTDTNHNVIRKLTPTAASDVVIALFPPKW
jgi:hypothetical protein